MAIAVNNDGTSVENPTVASSTLEPSFTIPKVNPRLKSEVIVAAFGVLNVILAHQIIALDLFSPVRADLRFFWSGVLALLAVALLLYCGGSIFSSALRDLRNKFVSRNVCTSLALMILAAYAISIAVSNFRLLATQPLFDSLVIVLFVVALDKFTYQSFLVSVANKVGLRFGELFPIKKKQRILTNTSQLEVNPDNKLADLDAESLKVGMTVRISDDDIIPCDMEIKNGSCEVRERKFSTRFQLRYRTAGNTLFAGSKIVRGEADCIITSLPEESVLAYFITLLNQRVNEETKLETPTSRQTETLYSLVLIFIAACTGLYWTDQQVSTDEIVRYSASVLLLSLVPRWLEISRYLKGLALSAAFSKGLLLKSTSILKKLVGIKTLAIDYSTDIPPGDSTLMSFELIDNRLDEAMLYSALASMYAAADAPELLNISEDFRVRSKSEHFLDISDLGYFSGRGLYARVQEADFSVGTEDFLLERGVEIQPSEIGTPRGGQELLYVAIGTELVARMYITRPFLGDGRELSTELNYLGIRPLLLSTGDANLLDEAAKSAGIEMAYSAGSLSSQAFITKLATASPVALLASASTPEDFLKASTVSFSVFDEIRWEISRTDIIAFNRGVGFVADSWRLARSYERTLNLNAILSVGLTALLLILAVSGYMAPAITAVSCAVASVFMYLSIYMLFPRSQRL
ncbi:MAG: hypothetical protein R3A13_02660 [Bdellovibrionota bacterium]